MSTRIAIMGNSGSGKTTLARMLSLNGRIPVFDLDTIAWRPEPPPRRRPLSDARADLEGFIASRSDWIIEGCYGELIEAACDYDPELILLNPGTERCIQNCLARPWESHKYSSREAQDRNLEMLLQWVREYETRVDDCSLQRHREIFAGYAGPKREITSLS